MLIPARVAIALQEDGWILRNDVIWSKPSVAPRPEADRLRLSHEHFFHFVKKRPDRRAAYYYDRDAAEDGALDVVTCTTRSGRDGHSATFPLELVIPRVLSSSPPRGLVIDPFCGTGTTLVAAVASGRLAQGFELSPTWAKKARDRVRKARLAQVQLAPTTEDQSPSRFAKNSSDVSVMKRSSTV
jgi:DNA modification methylase